MTYGTGDEQLDEYIVLLQKFMDAQDDDDVIAIEDLLQELDVAWLNLTDEQCERANKIVEIIKNDRTTR